MKWRGLKLILALVSAFMWLDVPWLCLDVRGQSVVFPGAQGFGIETPAGRGGRIIRVTNLNASGPGSLREALLASGPRVVVFEVGGAIDFGMENINIWEPYLTVAGQTAPSPGITIMRGAFTIFSHDTLIQHVRFRLGRMPVTGGPQDSLIVLLIWAGARPYNIVIDHCSVAWGTNDGLSVAGGPGPEFSFHDITISNCIIAETLPGDGQCGSLIGPGSNIALIGNLYANNDHRNPIFGGDTTGVIVNNVIFNPRTEAIELGPYAEGTPGLSPAVATIVGNVVIPGNDTISPHLLTAHTSADVYLEDNIVQGFSVPPLKGGLINLAQKPLWPSGFKALPASEVVRYVATHVGARPMDRDEVDNRIIRQMLDGTGRIISTQEEVGGYPTAKMTRCRLRIPETDIDTWLARLAGDLEAPNSENSEGFETSNFIAFDWRRYDAENWTVTSGEKNSGEYSAMAGSISDNESSTLSIRLDCISGDISFYCKVSSERDCDRLEFYIDGIRQDKWSGEKDWAEVSFPVTAGRRTFEWTYSKDGSESIDDDTAWIDDIVFPILNDIGLAAHWALDETEDAVAPDSAAGHDGILNGNPAWRPAEGALEFDGTDDYVTTPFVLDPADGPFSVFARVRGGTPGQVIVSQIKGANWLMAGASDGGLATELKGAGRAGKTLESAASITDGTWHRVGFVWDGANRILYVDEIEVARDTQANLIGSTGDFTIGAGSTLVPGTFFSGLIDDVRIYNRAVSP